VKFVDTSDLHIHPFKVGSSNGGRDRLDDGLSVLRQSLELARNERCPWIFGGDLKHPKNVWPQEALNGVHNAFYEYRDVPKLLMPGNHDGLFGEFGSGLQPFSHIEGVTVVDAPWAGEWEGMNLAAWPYGLKRLASLPAFLDAAEKAGSKILLAHLMFRGVALGPTDAHLPGAGSPVDSFRVGDLFDFAVVGDIHKGQWYGAAGKVNRVRSWHNYNRDQDLEVDNGGFVLRAPGKWKGEAFYPGSPYQQSWGEVAEWPKGFLLINEQSGKVEFRTAKSPRFRAVEVPSQANLRGLCELPKGCWQNDVVRLMIPDSVLSERGSAGMVDVVRARVGARELRAVPRRAERQKGEAVSAHAGMKPEELLEAWTKAHELSGVAGDVLLRSGVELLRDSGEDA